jgi:hypothetical protein
MWRMSLCLDFFLKLKENTHTHTHMFHLPSELLRQVFLYARSPTAWIIFEEFERRAKEEADIDAHEEAAERHYANIEYQNEMEAFALYAAAQEMEEEEWY